MAACNVFTEGILQGCRSVGGIKTFYIADYDHVSAYTTDSGASFIVDAVTMSGSTKFYQFKPVKETGSADCKFVGNNVSGYYETTIKMAFNKQEASKRLIIKAISELNVVIIAQFQSGDYFIYGLDNGLQINEYLETSGMAAADKNGYDLTFTSNSESFPAYQISATVVAGLD